MTTTALCGVPRGRLALTHDRASFDLVTVQHQDVLERLRCDRAVFPDPDRSSYLQERQFATAYRWMAAALHQTRATHGRFDPGAGAMFWLWAHITREALVNDAREYGPGHVVLRCRIPRERVLLSDFAAYHGILNEDIVWAADELAAGYADDEFLPPLQRELDDTYGAAWSLAALTARDQARVRATWGNVLLSEPPTRGDWAQACVSHLELADVVSVHTVAA